jgi:Putative MetA-pathway of phenol degradation
MNFMKYIIVGGLLVASVHVAWAQSAPQESTGPESTGTAEVSPPKQTRYNPSNPTPPDEMRTFVPDRPYVTDSPYTVDPGHWLLEAGLFEYTGDQPTFAFGDMEIRFGVTSNAEAEALFTAYTYTHTRQMTGARLKQSSGFSDFTLRSKVNILGNNGGPVAIAVIPFVVFPTDGADGIGNRGFSGGVVVPVEFALPADFLLRAASTIQTIHEAGGGSHVDYINSAALGHPITRKLSTYIEFWTESNPEGHLSWAGTVDTGLIYQPADNWELDAGVNIGVTRAARADRDVFPFIGAAWRY